MTNWKNIHLDFTEELQKEWEGKGFGYKECEEWINAGLRVNDASYARWLRCAYREGNCPLFEESKWFNDYANKKELEKEYSEYCVSIPKKWADIHKDFEIYHLHKDKWENLGFDPQEAKLWINAGLEVYGRGKKYHPSQIRKKELEKEYKEWERELEDNSKQVQEYLDFIFPFLIRKQIKVLNISGKNLVGKLDLSDFINLEKLEIYHTNIDSGLETFPDSLEVIVCSDKQNYPQHKIWKINDELTLYGGSLKAWKEAHPELMNENRIINSYKDKSIGNYIQFYTTIFLLTWVFFSFFP